MDICLLCILWFLLQNATVVKGSDSEKNEKNTLLQNLRIREATSPNPHLTSPEYFVTSNIGSDNTVSLHNDVVPSTSNDLSYSLPCCESSVNSSSAKTENGFDKSGANNLISQNESSLHKTVNTISTDINLMTNKNSTGLIKNISPNCSEQGELVNILDIYTTIPDEALKEIKEYLFYDDTSKVKYCSQRLNSCLYTLDDIIEIIEDDLQSSVLKSTHSLPIHADCVKALENDKNKSSTTSACNNSNNDEELLGYSIKTGELVLSIRRHELNNNITILKHIYSVMIKCELIDTAQCKKGLDSILEISENLSNRLVVSSFICRNNFLRYRQAIYNSKSYDYFSKDINPSSQFLSSLSIYMLGLLLMYMAPTSFDIINQKKSLKRFLNKNVLRIDIFKCTLKKKKRKEYLSQLNKLRWINKEKHKTPQLLAFSHVLLLPKERSESSALETCMLEYYKKIVLLKKKCIRTLESLSSKIIYQIGDIDFIISAIKKEKLEAESFHQLLEQLLSRLSNNIKSKLKTVNDITLFATYWFSVLYLECVGAMKKFQLNQFVSFYIFQEFFKDCQCILPVEDMLQHKELSFFINNIDNLSDLFVHTYLRIFKMITVDVIKVWTNLCKELGDMKTKIHVDINVEKNSILRTTRLEICGEVHKHTEIWKKIIQQRRKMKKLLSIRKLIRKIDKNIDVLKEKTELLNNLENDTYKTMLEETYKKIKKNYEMLYNLLNESNDSEIVKDVDDDFTDN